jgi:hypothetical protein
VEALKAPLIALGSVAAIACQAGGYGFSEWFAGPGLRARCHADQDGPDRDVWRGGEIMWPGTTHAIEESWRYGSDDRQARHIRDRSEGCSWGYGSQATKASVDTRCIGVYKELPPIVEARRAQ